MLARTDVVLVHAGAPSMTLTLAGVATIRVSRIEHELPRELPVDRRRRCRRMAAWTLHRLRPRFPAR